MDKEKHTLIKNKQNETWKSRERERNPNVMKRKLIRVQETVEEKRKYQSTDPMNIAKHNKSKDNLASTLQCKY